MVKMARDETPAAPIRSLQVIILYHFRFRKRRLVRGGSRPNTSLRVHVMGGVSQSHYDVLGVNGRTASTEEIKRAYKSLVRVCVSA